MTFNNLTLRILFRVVVLAASLFALAYLCFHEFSYGWRSICFTLSLISAAELISYVSRMQKEIKQFTEAVRYKDFTIFYNLKDSPLIVKDLRSAFNEVNLTFKKLNTEKETQYHHLKTILELVDTGILSYDETGAVKWLNDSFKNLFSLPGLKSLDGLMRRNSDLKSLIENKALEAEKYISIKTNKNAYNILVSKASFKVEGVRNYLLAVKNVNDAVDEAETIAWQKLLRVLTHEIMNSVAPISSLAQTVQVMISDMNQETPNHALNDIRESIDVISSRSEGLLRFAETYRSLSKISAPIFTAIGVDEIFHHLSRLMEQEARHRNIELKWELKDAVMSIEVDISLIEQVIINLLTNAMDALAGQTSSEIKVLAYFDQKERVTIEVNDNGPGIPAELLENIFVPFFTTKQHGSGIGLSLSKQIMQLHKGSITVESESGLGTRFRLNF